MNKIPGSGRKKGTPNKLTGELREMIRTALSDAGGAEYLKRQAEENPTAFMALLGRLLPAEVKADIATTTTEVHYVVALPEAALRTAAGSIQHLPEPQPASRLTTA